MCEKFFGVVITNSDGKEVPGRVIGEPHVKEDLGRIPTATDWLMCIRPERWMNGRVEKLEETLEVLRSVADLAQVGADYTGDPIDQNLAKSDRDLVDL